MCRDETVVPGVEGDAFPGDPEFGVTLEQANPLVLDLIVERRIWLIAAKNALDPDIALAQEVLEDLARGDLRQILEKIAAPHVDTSGFVFKIATDSGRPVRGMG
jgi:hypothetical protein